ncbi:MAG: hypothetical protein J4478_00080 [Candidatus Diapherotrites archaeon]|uniref:AbrB/MazE/SpoVT family DNA-binding domain-containing protein n=1 Tax=Candidatus Iainarchaeum sp. TaxID=3101447 RepID=A0A7J4JUC6_9ARCH|nr:hypothetical protein [Candidatus Diapherotrites archaeon]HIH21393.1 hypothetical protein [Candidatus Diapherotrites archaeon]
MNPKEFKAKITKKGKALAIKLPKKVVEQYGLKEGEKYRILPKSKKEMRIIIG